MFNNKGSAKEKQLEQFGAVDIKRATQIIQEIIQEPQELGEERAGKNKEIIENAMAGEPNADAEAQKIIATLLGGYDIEVEGMNRSQVAYDIYKHTWGLDVLEEAYRDPEVNELRINAPNAIYALRMAKNERLDNLFFKDDEHVRNLISRITMHDQGVHLDKSFPAIESMRKDGTRITATHPPVTKHVTLVLRKPYPHLITPEEMIELGTLDKKTWAVLRTLVRGRANILISGGVGSGKTTLLRTTLAEVNPISRIVVLETDSELMLSNAFPNWDVIEFEEHKETKGGSLEDLFRIALRESPTIIIVGEFRGSGEAREAIRACVRGHNSMATAHFSSPREAIEGTARMLLEEGLNLPVGIAVITVAAAYNVVVQMFGDPIRGAIKVESVTEVIPTINGVKYQDLIRWAPQGVDYLSGGWQLRSGLSSTLIERLCKHITLDEIRGAGLA